jgi:hypothetical protein
MKTHKKILAGLGLFIISLLLPFVLSSQKVIAATPAEARDALTAGRYEFRDKWHVRGTGINVDGNNLTITWYDSNTGDGTYNFKPQSGGFCRPNGMSNDEFRDQYGITFTQRPANQSSLVGRIWVGYSDGQNCDDVITSRTVANPGGWTATAEYIWDGDAIKRAQNGTPIYRQMSIDGQPIRAYGSNTATGQCGGYPNGMIVVDSSSNNSGTRYVLRATSDGGQGNRRDAASIPQLREIFNPDTCYVWTNITSGNEEIAPITIAGERGNDAEAGGEIGDEVAPDKTCEAQWSNPLTWIACPLFNIAAGLTDELINLFEGQLCFKTDVATASAQATCNGNITDTSSIKPAWSAIKNIVSALLVIIMLIAIFAQAASIGPIDAYTLRKLLPRLVAAVILIQISWYLFSWMVNVVDDIGEGLMALLNGIFASSANVDINDLNQLLGHAGVGDGTAALVNWTAIIGLIVFGAVALPILLLMLFTAVVALLVALAVLVFRKVIIITLLLIAPVALLLWVLPNTERYWKMWWDNFIKVLLMFPIIVLIIEAGRIFAFVAGPAAGGGFIALFIVMVGFFGPLFILPKTFKWGGALMQATGNAAFKASDRYLTGEKAGANKYLRNRQQDWTEQRRRASVQRVANKEGFNPKRPWRLPLDQLRSGRLDPLKQVPGYREVGRRSVESYIHAGEEIYQKDVEAARAKVLREGQAIRARGGNWDRYFQMVGDGEESYYDDELKETIPIGKRNELEKVAAMKQTAILGAATNWRYLESKSEEMNNMGRATLDDGSANRDYNPEKATELRKFFDDNVQTIMPKMPHIYTGVNAAAESNAGTISQIHPVGVESILGNLSETINTSSSASKRATAQKQLVTFLQNFQEAADNPNIQVDNGAMRAVKGFLDSDQGADFRREINYASRDPARPGADGRVPREIPVLPLASEVSVDPNVRAELNRLKTEVADKINPMTGAYSPAAAEPGGEGVLRVEHEPERPPPGTQPPLGGGRFNPPPGGSSTPI